MNQLLMVRCTNMVPGQPDSGVVKRLSGDGERLEEDWGVEGGGLALRHLVGVVGQQLH